MKFKHLTLVVAHISFLLIDLICMTSCLCLPVDVYASRSGWEYKFRGSEEVFFASFEIRKKNENNIQVRDTSSYFAFWSSHQCEMQENFSMLFYTLSVIFVSVVVCIKLQIYWAFKMCTPHTVFSLVFFLSSFRWFIVLSLCLSSFSCLFHCVCFCCRKIKCFCRLTTYLLWITNTRKYRVGCA